MKQLKMSWRRKSEVEKLSDHLEHIRPRTKKEIAKTKRIEKSIQKYFTGIK